MRSSCFWASLIQNSGDYSVILMICVVLKLLAIRVTKLIKLRLPTRVRLQYDGISLILQFSIQNLRMATIFYLIVSLQLVLALLQPACQPYTQIPDLWSATASFTLAPIENNTMAYAFESYTLPTARPYDSNSNLQFAFSIKEFSVSTSQLLYFDLLVIKTFQSSLLLNFIYEPNKWLKISYNYWISFRSDLIMLIETYTDKQFANSTPTYQVTSSIDLDHHNHKGTVVMVFLVGIRYKRQTDQQAHRLSFGLISQKVDQNNVQVQFQSHSALSIEAISLSFVVYQPSSAGFGSYGGTLTRSTLQGSTTENLHYLFPRHSFFALYGLSALAASEQKQDSINFSSSLSPLYDFEMSVDKWQRLNSIEVTYLIAGNMPSKICQQVPACQAQGSTFISGHDCVRRCPRGSRVVNYIDGAAECQECPQNQHFDQSSQSCLCDDGFTMDANRTCRKTNINIGLAVTNAKTSAQDTLSDDVPTNRMKDCLTLQSIQQSNKNIFVTLKASPSVTQDQKSAEAGFMKISFSDGRGASSYYCNQCHDDKTAYDCLLLFASGVPRELFTMRFECSVSSGRQTHEICRLSVPYQSVKPSL